jgi:hypothetical protein
VSSVVVSRRQAAFDFSTHLGVVIIRAGGFAPQLEEVRTGEIITIALSNILGGLSPEKKISPPHAPRVVLKMMKTLT